MFTLINKVACPCTRTLGTPLCAGSFLAYGVETKRDAIPLNVGVLLMEVRGFARELSGFRAFGEVSCPRGR